jgi:hypothetical protein
VKKSIAWLGLFLVAGSGFALPNPTRPASPFSLRTDFGSPPLYFIPNHGQTDPRALFYAKTGAYTLWVTREGLTFDDGSGSRLIFRNANREAEVAAADPTDYRVSYFYGRDESKWTTDIPTFRTVIFKNLYDGVDLKIYGAERQVEYDWIVKAGARPDPIRWTYAGVAATSLDREGNLVVETPAGRLVHRRPDCYQIIDGRKIAVKGGFRKTGNGEYGFAVGPYDTGRELVIDPVVLVFSTYLGGRGVDDCYSISIDRTGAVYVAGYTDSMDFPPKPQTKPRADTMVSKLSPDGKSLVYSAFFPTAGEPIEDALTAIFVSAKGAVYLAGTTQTHNFPVKNAFQKTYGGGGSDAFLLEITPSGKSLVFSTFLGGSELEGAGSIAVDADGSIYVAGQTFSKNFPVKNAFQKSLRGYAAAFISKFNPDGRSLVYSTFLGSTLGSTFGAMAIDGTGSVYICGTTRNGFPVKKAFQKKFGGKSDTFISKLAPSGQALVYSSYLGGAGWDGVSRLAVDGSGAVYITGQTDGAFPLKNAFQKVRKGSEEVFVSKVAPDGRSLVYSTYLTGMGCDFPAQIAVDGSGAAYVVGGTSSPDWPLKNPFRDRLNGSWDGFLSVLSPNGRSLIYSTYLGGVYWDTARALLVDLNGAIYVAGWTNSPDVALLNPYQKKFAGKWDIFVMKFSSQGTGL